MKDYFRNWFKDFHWYLIRWKYTLIVCKGYDQFLNRVTEVAQELLDASQGKKDLTIKDYRRLADRLTINDKDRT